MSNDTSGNSLHTTGAPDPHSDVTHASHNEEVETTVEVPWHTWPIGQRVMIRATLPPGGTHGYTDYLGVIIQSDSSGLTLETRSGAVQIAAERIAIGKPIPPPPARRARRSPNA
ncbi:hypothetical protein [Jonesia quinghaiensis]|uniref:putative acetyltransferase n=1 Tax=Jonesia quinghaiensis TaxID=262806 RepID=UPI0012F9892B|nr:hypothetical protein [Jonesia quinghaiensis]